MDRIWVGFGAALGLGTVAMAAFTAHALGGLPAGGLQSARDAVQMQGWHSLALLFTGLWSRRGGWLTHLAGLCFLAGTVIFCGAVYALVLADIHFPGLAPVGGTVLMAGWVLLLLSCLRPARS